MDDAHINTCHPVSVEGARDHGHPGGQVDKHRTGVLEEAHGPYRFGVVGMIRGEAKLQVGRAPPGEQDHPGATTFAARREGELTFAPGDRHQVTLWSRQPGLLAFGSSSHGRKEGG